MQVYDSTILITGGTTGLGYWTAYELAKRFPTSKVIIASRSDRDKAARTLTKSLQADSKVSTTEQIEWMCLDLGSTAEVRKFISTFASKSYPPVTHLLLNAALQFHKGKSLHMSPDGVESTFAVNHLGHALLFFLLKPYLSVNARVVITGSGTHDPAQKTMIPDAVYESAELLAHPTDGQGYESKMKGGQRYASSKLASVLFTYALERRFKQARDEKRGGWTVAAFDPGLMPGTGLIRDAGPVMLWIAVHIMPRLLWLLRLLARSQNVHLPQESAKNLALLATMEGENARATSGTYFEGEKAIKSSVASYDDEKQEDLWRWTVDFLAKDEDEKNAIETF